MNTISVNKLNFRQPVEFKIVCNGFGCSHKHYFIFCSLHELSTTLTTLSFFLGFDSIQVYKKAANGIYSVLVEL